MTVQLELFRACRTIERDPDTGEVLRVEAFDRLTVESLPRVVPRLLFHARLRGEPQQRVRYECRIRVPGSPPAPSPAKECELGPDGGCDIILERENFVLRAVGTCTCDLLLDGIKAATLSFEVVLTGGAQDRDRP